MQFVKHQRNIHRSG